MGLVQAALRGASDCSMSALPTTYLFETRGLTGAALRSSKMERSKLN